MSRATDLRLHFSINDMPRNCQILSLNFIGVRAPAAATLHHRIMHLYAPIVRASMQWNYSRSNNVNDAHCAYADSSTLPHAEPQSGLNWGALGCPSLLTLLCHIFRLFLLCPCCTSLAPASAPLLHHEGHLLSLTVSIPPYSESPSASQSYSYAFSRLTYRAAAFHFSR